MKVRPPQLGTVLGATALAVALASSGGVAEAAKLINGRFIKTGSVTGKQIKDQSVTVDDLAPGTLKSGPVGPTGATGAQGTDGAQGPAGTQGGQGPAGVGFTWKGTWSSSFAYATRDVVSYNGATWVAIASSTSSRPTTGSTAWSLWAQAGTSVTNTVIAAGSSGGTPCDRTGGAKFQVGTGTPTYACTGAGDSGLPACSDAQTVQFQAGSWMCSQPPLSSYAFYPPNVTSGITGMRVSDTDPNSPFVDLVAANQQCPAWQYLYRVSIQGAFTCDTPQKVYMAVGEQTQQYVPRSGNGSLTVVKKDLPAGMYKVTIVGLVTADEGWDIDVQCETKGAPNTAVIGQLSGHHLVSNYHGVSNQQYVSYLGVLDLPNPDTIKVHCFQPFGHSSDYINAGGFTFMAEPIGQTY